MLQMIIVPAWAQVNNNVPQVFFKIIFNNEDRANQTFNAFLAISSFGNIVVWTFTAARMKQEIAKQCFIPFASFFATNKDVSFGRLLMWLEGGSKRPGGRRFRFLNPHNHQEKTPVGALILHLVTCIILIIATYSTTADNAYSVLSNMFSYILAAWFGSFLALGILLLHYRGPPATEPVQTPDHNHVPDQKPIQQSWKNMIKGTVNPKVGIVCAALYLVGSLYPVIASWVPPTPTGDVAKTVAWYVVPLASWCVLAFSALWFLGFVAIATFRSRRGGKQLVYISEPEFDWAQRSQQDLGGGLILVHEAIYRVWQGNEAIHDTYNDMDGSVAPGQGDSDLDHRNGLSGPGFENTDFADFRRNEDFFMDEIAPEVARDGQVRDQQNKPEY